MTQQDLAVAVIPKTTQKKANWAHKIFQEWRVWKRRTTGTCIPDVNISTDENVIQETLSCFIREVRKGSGERYPGKTLLEIITSLQKYLEISGKKMSLVSGKIKYALDLEMQASAKLGLGMISKKAEELTFEHEESLWQQGILGMTPPMALLKALFFTLGTNFGLRGGQEHRSLTINNLSVHENGGIKYLMYTELVSKTFSGGLKDKGRKPRQARAYQNKSKPERCPVNIFETYISQCPRDALFKSLYLQPKSKFNCQVKFTSNPIGHNKLADFTKIMMAEAGVKGHFTNHSLRVTTATRMFQAGLPEQLIKQQTGHKSEAVRTYKRPSEAQMFEVSSVLQGSTHNLAEGNNFVKQEAGRTNAASPAQSIVITGNNNCIIFK